MITILTALRGNSDLTRRWLAAATTGEVEAKIIAAVNNDEDEQAVKSATGQPVPVTLYGGNDEKERINHVARIYAELIRGADTDLVILWDDDVLPPFKGLQRLAGAMLDQKPDVVGIVSAYPFQSNSEQAVLFFQPFDHLGAFFSSLPGNGLHQVWGGGTGFSIWRREALLKTIPWSTAETEGYVPGWDRDLAIKLKKLKLRTLCEMSIRCRHDLLPR